MYSTVGSTRGHYTLSLIVENGTDNTYLVTPMSLNLIHTGHDQQLKFLE